MNLVQFVNIQYFLANWQKLIRLLISCVDGRDRDYGGPRRHGGGKKMSNRNK